LTADALEIDPIEPEFTMRFRGVPENVETPAAPRDDTWISDAEPDAPDCG